jgi:cytochrome c nitrite reductase small subunit
MTARQRATIAAALAFGIAAGVGVFTFGYAKGASYLTNDPAACANCHIMSEHFSAWQKGSHRTVTCNDCHTPHNFVGKYVTKARNGFWHSFYFTTGRYPDPLRITERNRQVTEETCRYCHEAIVEAIDPARSAGRGHGPTVTQASLAGLAAVGQSSTGHGDARLSCIRCHTYVGHLVR